MARIFRGRGRSIMGPFISLAAVCLVVPLTATAQLYDQPVLVIDPGMHTAPIYTVDVDPTGSWAVSGSNDKSVRIWSLSDGRLIRTIRMPTGSGPIGKIYAVAINRDGKTIAAGGYTNANDGKYFTYLFEANTGKLKGRISSEATAHSLGFSPDGRYLAVGLYAAHGLRIYDREAQWNEIFRDEAYEHDIWGIKFAADGRLAVASEDGKLRLYDRKFKLIVPPRRAAAGGSDFFGIAFSPDGGTLAAGLATPLDDKPFVQLFDGHSLVPRPGPNLKGLIAANPALFRVAFSKDGKTLYAGGGLYVAGFGRPVLAWNNAGLGERRMLLAGESTIGDLSALPEGGILISTQDPVLAVLGPDDMPRWRKPSPKADFRDQYDTVAVSADGSVVDFGFEVRGKSPLRFDLQALKLSRDPLPDPRTKVARQTGLAIKGWLGSSPTLNDRLFAEFEPYEFSRSLSIHPDGNRFVLGTDWYLRTFDAQGRPLWTHDAPQTAWVVNITGDGRLVLAGYDDGTIRWYRMDDGRELLALFVLKDQENWVAWTPEGFYAATPGAFGVLQWLVNRGFDAAAETVPVSAIARLKRPDALPLVLQELETVRALGIADLKAARRDVQTATKSAKAPGARLHVLTIGVSEYGDKAKDLRLKFAGRDAQDVANALVNTQEGGLYAGVDVQYLHDDTANKTGIFDALEAMQRNMEKSTGGDLAVIMFSGHGTVIDGQFYLVPYGVDNSTPARRKSFAIAATEFQSEISKLATRGRVLVLLDACRSEGLIGKAVPGADVLRSVLAASNVTVLTSSMADKLSREDEKWQHGAFTKALLDALGSGDDIDTDRNGVISMAELTAYLARHLDELTGGEQQLGLEQRFQGDVFVSGL
jgi:WD40 repeat protein